MKSRDFCFWLQGLFEIGEYTSFNAKQTEIIKRHLNLVFKHEIDPSMGDQKHQEELDQIHGDDYLIMKFGPQPAPGWECNIHGWYNPEEGRPRC